MINFRAGSGDCSWQCRTWRAIGAAAGVVVFMASVGCGSASTANGEHEGSAVGRPVHWRVVDTPSSKAVEIGAMMGECVGYPEPRIARVEVSVSRKRTVITAYRSKIELEKGRPCLGVLVERYKKIQLARPVAHQNLYDGSFNPARQRWPE